MQKYISEEALRKLYPRGYAVISIDHIRHNLEVLHCHSGLPLYCVVKANAYGHGAALISPRLESLDCVRGFATATVHEAVELRAAGIKKEILVLGTAFPGEYRTAIDHNITLTLYRLEDAKNISDLATDTNKTIDVHVAIDTGMGRIGLPATKDSVKTIRQLLALPGLRVCGIFTHFARADEQDVSFTNDQLRAFQTIREALADMDIDCWHVSNSAAI
ncbi:MAG: alanine racemase, partial [Lachnospiraceae bacterium]|nr:alanine racemase [Lachnospiraceae bacterium]